MSGNAEKTRLAVIGPAAGLLRVAGPPYAAADRGAVVGLEPAISPGGTSP